jgi:flagellar protein FlaG
MLIQNAVNMAQVQQPDGIVNSGLPSNGGATVVANTSSAEQKSGVQLPQNTPITPQQPSPEQLKTAVEGINRVMQQSNLDLEFVMDPDTNRPIVKMVDAKTGELIRQIPSEEMIAITRSIDQFLAEHQLQHGLLLTQKA